MKLARPTTRRRTALGAMAGALSLIATLAVPSAEATAPNNPGCTDGVSRVFCDGTWLGDAGLRVRNMTASDRGLTLTLNLDTGSTFYVDVASGTPTGEWSMSGRWTMDFKGSAGGVSLNGQAQVNESGDGKLSGSAAKLDVTGNFTNSGHINVAGANRKISNSYPMSGITVVVTGGTCVETIGEWTMSWEQLARDAGWTGNTKFTGDFVAVRQPGFEAQAFDALRQAEADGTITQTAIDKAPISAAARQLMTERLNWRQAMADTSVMNDGAVTDALGIIDRMSLATYELRNNNGCESPIDPTALQSITSGSANMVADLSERVASAASEETAVKVSTLRQLFNAATRHGLVGAGATATPERQLMFREAMKAQISAIANKGLVADDDGGLSGKPGATAEESAEALDAIALASDAGQPAVVGFTEVQPSSELGALADSFSRAVRTDVATPPTSEGDS